MSRVYGQHRTDDSHECVANVLRQIACLITRDTSGQSWCLQSISVRPARKSEAEHSNVDRPSQKHHLTVHHNPSLTTHKLCKQSGSHFTRSQAILMLDLEASCCCHWIEFNIHKHCKNKQTNKKNQIISTPIHSSNKQKLLQKTEKKQQKLRPTSTDNPLSLAVD